MAHPYPPHLDDVHYVGRRSSSLEFTTVERRSIFTAPENVDLAREQILRAGRDHGVLMAAYCFMPDHLHLVVDAQRDDSNCKAYIKAAKQYSAYYFKQAHRARLWERYGYEHIIRDDVERAFAIAYVVANPVTVGLVSHPSEYPFLGSDRYALAELLEISESLERL